MKSMIATLIGLFFVIGCAGLQPVHTSSGRPEITICRVSKTELMEKTVAAATMDGYNIRSTSSFQVVMGKPVSNILVAAFMGSRYDSTPEYRLIWTFADIGNSCTHLGIVIQIVTNPGSGFEKITDISNGKDAHQMQEQLEGLKAQIENN